MKNFSITDDKGQEFWISRSCAAECAVFRFIKGTWHVLANKRGPGCLNNVGLWNIPSGYLDYDESLEECAVRETHEETGICIDTPVFYTIDSIPQHDKRQNIVVVFWTIYEGHDVLTDRYSEPGEIAEIRWIPINELDRYTWINDRHKERIINIYREHIIELCDPGNTIDDIFC